MIKYLLAVSASALLAFDYFPPPAPEPATLVFTGDNKIEGRTVQRVEQHGEQHPFKDVAEHISAADIAFGNLESPITGHPYKTNGKSWETIQAGKNFVFKSPPEYSARIYSNTGYDIFSLANNHAMDYRGEGLIETCQELGKYGIEYVGGGRSSIDAARPVIIERGGIRVGYLAWSMIVPALSQAREDSPGINAHERRPSERMSRAISALAEEADIVMASFHWGAEGASHPARYQREIARAAIDAGADLVIGHHTHSIQGLEYYGSGLIAYSLGNFLFTGASPKLVSFILAVDVDTEGIADVRLLPVWLHDGHPEPTYDERVLKHIERVCQPFETSLSAGPAGWLRVNDARESMVTEPAVEEPTPVAQALYTSGAEAASSAASLSSLRISSASSG